MLVIAGSLRFAAEDRQEVLASLAEVTRHSRQDAGCVDYWWAEDLEEPNTFRFFECWESEEHFEQHVAAPHEKEFGKRNLRRITGATAAMYAAEPALGPA